MAALTQDTQLGGRYRLINRIAIGGMGEVWRAEDQLLGRLVAVKVLKAELTTDPTFLARFRTEARTTASLSHAGIASVYDYGEVGLDLDGDGTEDTSTAYLVMELVEGEPLSAILAREGRLPTQRTLDIVGQAATALEAAHRTGMVHRDVKPGNLLVSPDGVVKITDFGIARVADRVPLTQSGMVVGTAQYFSPEQAEGRVVSSASDVYSLGVVAYECLAGRLPFVADSPVTVAIMQIRDVPPPLPPDVPLPVHRLVAQAMAKDPRRRFGTGGEFAAAIRTVQDGRFGDGPAGRDPITGPPHGTGPLPRLLNGPGLGGHLPPGPADTSRPSRAGPGGALPPASVPPGMTSAPMAAPPARRSSRTLLVVLLCLLGAALLTTILILLVNQNHEPGNGAPGDNSPSRSTSPRPTSSASGSGGPAAPGGGAGATLAPFAPIDVRRLPTATGQVPVPPLEQTHGFRNDDN
ncbi:MAG TPA: serine/threonine-protein kinase [Mycobacteriales bacterium]|nr:serine/threonine-protein kinase [Mycobacteriales bacterium]